MYNITANTSLVANIVLLTSHYYGELLVQILSEFGPGINVVIIEHPNKIPFLPASVLSNSRLISFGSRFFISPSVLNKVDLPAYNFHPGPPAYPGWAPFSFALYNNATDYGVTVHEITEKIDNGKIIAASTFPIGDNETAQSLMDQTTMQMYLLFAELMPEFLKRTPDFKTLDVHWSGEQGTKKKFRDMCRMDLDLTEAEFKRRMKSFGDGDGENLPYIEYENRIYHIASDNSQDLDNCIMLHGQKFVLSV